MTNNAIKPLKRLIGLLQTNKKEVGQIYWLSLFSGIISLTLPFGIQLIINFIQGGTYSVSYYVLVVLITLGVALYSLIQIIELRIFENIQQKLFTYSGLEFTYRFPRIKIEELININAGDLANRFFDTIVLEKSVIKVLTDFSVSAIQIVISALVVCFYHNSFILLNVIIITVFYFGFKFTFDKTLKTGLLYSKYKYKTAYWIEEVANASSTFKLAGETDLPMNRTDELLIEYLNKRDAYYRWLNIQYIVINVSKTLYILGFLLIGGIMVMEQKMNIGQFVASEVLVLTIINGMDKILNTLKDLYDVFISLEKLAEVTDLNIEKQKKTDLFYSTKKGIKINVINLNFQYPQKNKNVLNNINLNIESNEKVLITGKNNSGKTTLIKVISSLYEIKEGDIKYNNISIQNIDKEKLRTDIGIYFHEDVIFNGTVWGNITVERKDTDSQFIYDIADKINFTKEIESFEKGYNTYIYSHGFGLSQSIINKILFLRTIATKPKLLLLENLQLNFIENERKKFIEIITDKEAPWTLICVDEITELAEKYDTIYIMDNGQIINKGNYFDLNKNI